jgi:hypothetical protein
MGGTGTAPAGMLGEDGDVAGRDVAWAPRVATSEGDAVGASRAAATGAAAVEPPAGAAWSRRV